MTNQAYIVEVGPRDGLQNIKDLLTFEQKQKFISYLLDKGFTDIEAGSFVRPDKVPAMADTAELADHFTLQKNKLWYLVPNLKGLEEALKHGVTQLAFFTATSETFNQKNIGMSVAKSVDGIKACVKHLQDKGYSFLPSWNNKPTAPQELKLRLYISTVIACPYDGKMKPEATVSLMNQLLPLGFAQVSLGDTIGVGVPQNWSELLQLMDPTLISQNRLALHCHDTSKTALACVAKGLEMGIRTFDSSIGGLGGCPFAPGAKGNLATEDLLGFLEKEGFKMGINSPLNFKDFWASLQS